MSNQDTLYIRRLAKSKDAAIWLVNGDAAREQLARDFKGSGQWRAQDYIPEGEIWIDDQEEPEQHAYLIACRVMESYLMQGNLSLEEAQEQSDKVEQALRSTEDNSLLYRTLEELGVVWAMDEDVTNIVWYSEERSGS